MLQVIANHSEGATRLLARLSEQVIPLSQDSMGFNSPVVAFKYAIHLGRLDPTVRLAASVSLLEQGSPIDDGAKEVAYVDKVERVSRPCPWKCSVVDFKVQVAGRPGRLHGG